MNGLREIARTLWIGGMWVIGIIVTPVLFSALENVTAGMVAGRLFAMIAWVGLVCGVFLMVELVLRNGARALKSGPFWLLVGMLLCIVINHFAVTPIITSLKLKMNHAAEGLFGGGFGTWHAISSLIYLVQSLMGLVYVLSNDN